ncbi:alpha-2-macroglobulin family protein [Azospirillum baldaniorum]|uniref:alpha-2-macroglobulin family protein n=1 Tax=Azospirillum baldaniorum TaxID=1064539 RepID=UPI001FCC4117|nr:alpha-2-macroglobulin family protein [Azospirillum baldaniorum]
MEGAPEGQPAYVTVAAVDDAVLQLTDQHSPNPIDHYLGKRRLGVELRDSFGRLIDPAVLDATRTRPGAAPRLRQVGVTVPQKSERVVSLFSGVLTVGPEGKVAVPLDVPDFQGRLRLMAVAWSGDKLGRSESSMLVADPVLADLGLPRFLAPGDRAVVPVTLDNVAGPAGAYTISLIASGAVSLSEGSIAVPELGKGKRAAAGRVLTANGVGTGHIALDVTGPDGLRITRQWEIPVRPASPLVTRRTATMLAPERSVELPADLLNGLRPETATAALSLGNLPDLDIPGLLTALERGGPGGLEMTASRALPLLSLGDVAVALGVASDERVKARVQRSVDRVLTFQRMDGAFAAWSPKGGGRFLADRLRARLPGPRQGRRLPRAGGAVSQGTRRAARRARQRLGGGRRAAGPRLRALRAGPRQDDRRRCGPLLPGDLLGQAADRLRPCPGRHGHRRAGRQGPRCRSLRAVVRRPRRVGQPARLRLVPARRGRRGGADGRERRG